MSTKVIYSPSLTWPSLIACHMASTAIQTSMVYFSTLCSFLAAAGVVASRSLIMFVKCRGATDCPGLRRVRELHLIWHDAAVWNERAGICICAIYINVKAGVYVAEAIGRCSSHIGLYVKRSKYSLTVLRWFCNALRTVSYPHFKKIARKCP